MTRTKHLTTSITAILALAAAVAAPAQAYESVNAATNQASSADQRSTAGGSSVNAILSERTPVAGQRAELESPNAILGAGNVAEPVVQTSAAGGSGGFDWSDALIGAGSAFGLVLLAGGAMVLTRRRRGPSVQPTV